MACDILYSEYEDIGSQINLYSCIQIMGIFHEMKYARQELWFKLEQLLANLYED